MFKTGNTVSSVKRCKKFINFVIDTIYKHKINMSSHADNCFEKEVHGFLETLKPCPTLSPFDATMNAVFIIRKLIGSTHWSNSKELLQSIKMVREVLLPSSEAESPILNIIRRILKLVREEFSDAPGTDNSVTESIQQSILMLNKAKKENDTKNTINLKSAIIESINELISELEACRDNIAMQALEYIHSDEIIMTLGYSRTVEKFLKNAARKRKFTVVVAENAPFFDGQTLAASLAESKISTTVIADNAVFALMARVNKVILGANLVLADGGVIAANGTQAIAFAAKQHRVPVIVCAGLFKLSPRFVCSYQQDTLTRFLSPNDIANFSQMKNSSRVTVCNPVTDYISAGFVDLFISDVGGNVPSYLYRLLSEMYNPQDHLL